MAPVYGACVMSINVSCELVITVCSLKIHNIS